MNNYSNRVYSVAQIRQCEHMAIEQGAPEADLMAEAGAFAWDALQKNWPSVQHIDVCCGPGNNGGDGYIVAAHAAKAGKTVRCVVVGDLDKQSEVSKAARQQALSAGAYEVAWEPSLSIGPDTVVVDALCGIGLSGELRSPFLDVVEWINSQSRPVIAIDCPSGLHMDTGKPLGQAVKATITATFIGLKQGLFLGEAKAYTGQIFCHDLNIKCSIFEHVDFLYTKMELDELMKTFPKRPVEAHKGTFGHVYIVGGDDGYGGAVILAAEAALRMGAGLVSVATHSSHVAEVLAQRPEVMVRAISGPDELDFEGKTAVVLGPGLGQSVWGKALWGRCISSELPMVVDADGLNFLAERPHSSIKAVLTPHPGEAGRLLGHTAAEVQSDRYKSLQELQALYPHTAIVLKGAATLVSSDEKPWLCPYGNPGMSVGGMGDVLSGMIGSLLAQGVSEEQAVSLGVALHAKAGDMVSKHLGLASVLPSDLIEKLPILLASYT